MLSSRLERLEQRITALTRREQFLTVTFLDGTKRRTKAADVIPLLLADSSVEVTGISGSPGRDSGQLLTLLQGIVTDHHEDDERR